MTFANALAIDQKAPVASQELVPVNKRPEQQYNGDKTTSWPTQTTSTAIKFGQLDSKSAGSSPDPLDTMARLDTRRPIWALAHMVNSIKELDYRLARGANAIEVDVTFGRDGDPLYTYHGPPCDCWRHCYQSENIRDYLNYVREITIDQRAGTGQNLTLLFLDLKLEMLDQRAKSHAGTQLAKIILDHLFRADNSSTNELSLVISVNHVHDVDLVHNFIHQLELNNASHLLRRIGFDVGMNDDLQLIENMWHRFGSELNLWQGDGYTNCFSPFYNLERLTRALSKRDQARGFPAKVYHWTIDLHDRMRESLRLGVDAIMTNHPERVLNVLQEPEMAHNYRLATSGDNPFRKLTRDAVGRAAGETARYQRSASVSSGGFIASLLDVLASWLNYVREIPIFSLPTTLGSSSRSAHKHSKQNASSQQLVASSTTLVRLQAPSTEYSIDSSSASQRADSSSPAQTTDGDKRPPTSEHDLGEGLAPYEGPKWYTTLASNVLVSLMKIMLPT